MFAELFDSSPRSSASSIDFLMSEISSSISTNLAKLSSSCSRIVVKALARPRTSRNGRPSMILRLEERKLLRERLVLHPSRLAVNLAGDVFSDYFIEVIRGTLVTPRELLSRYWRNPLCLDHLG